MQGFFQRAIVQFGNALSNVATIVSDAGAYEDLLSSLGWPSTAMPSQFADLLPSAQRLQSLVAASGTAPSYADLLAIVQEAQTFYAAVEGLSQVPSDISDSGFVEHFKQELVHFLVIEGLRTHSQVLYQILSLLRFIQEVPVPQTSTRQAYMREKLDLHQLAGFIKQPVSYLQDVFGANGDIDLSDEMLLQIMDLVQALGLTAGLADAGSPLLLGQNHVVGDAPPNLALQLSFLNKLLPTVSNSPLEVWLSRYTYPTDTESDYSDEGGERQDYGQTGLLLRLSKADNAPIDLPIGESLHLEVPDFGNAQSALEVRVSLHDFGVSYPGASSAQAAFTGQEVVVLRYTPTEPLLLLGGPDTTRFEATGVRLSIALNTSAGQKDITFTLSLLESAMVLASAEGDSFLSSVLPTQSRFGVAFDLELSTSKGFRFNGGPRTSTLNLRTLTVGPAKLLGTRLGLSAVDNHVKLSATANFNVTLGPVQLSFTETGVAFGLRIEDKKISPEFGFSPPTGLGIEVNSDTVTGGGYLFIDPVHHRYAGVAHLEIKAGNTSINVNALGILQTELPDDPNDYSLLLLLTATFAPIQLGLGFTLSGLGGLLGVHRQADVDYLRGMVRAGQIKQLLFAESVMDDPAGALALVDAAFPVAQGRYVIGLMAQLGWGSVANVLTLDVALLVELPTPVRILLLGVLQAVLPSEKNDKLKLRADFLGFVDFGAKKASFDASLSDSHILSFTLTGDMAFRLYQGDSPLFVITAGGFHPSFQPPAGAALTGLRRLVLGLSSGDLQLSLASYFAVTSNTVQFGSHLDLVYNIGHGFRAEGHFGFDVLFQFSPFHVLAHVEAGVAIKRGNSEYLSVYLSLDVDGPGPWHVWGEASFRVLFFKIRFSVNTTIGSSPGETALPAPNVHDELLAALRQPASWQVEAPATPALPGGVILRSVTNADGQVFLDPRGALSLRQRVAPLCVQLERYGNNPTAPTGGRYFELAEFKLGGDTYVPGGVQSPLAETRDFFAPAQFKGFTDAQKLSAPSFERLPNGLRLSNLDALLSASEATRRVVEYEKKFLSGASGGSTNSTSSRQAIGADTYRRLSRGSALGREVQQAQPSARAAQPVSWQNDTYEVVYADTLERFDPAAHNHPGHEHFRSHTEAEQYCRSLTATDSTLEVLVVPTYQLALA